MRMISMFSTKMNVLTVLCLIFSLCRLEAKITSFRAAEERNNSALDIQPIKVRSVNRVTCLTLCTEHPQCRAFNFEPGPPPICKLLSKALCDDLTLKLTDKQGSSYYDHIQSEDRNLENRYSEDCGNVGRCSDKCPNKNTTLSRNKTITKKATKPQKKIRYFRNTKFTGKDGFEEHCKKTKKEVAIPRTLKEMKTISSQRGTECAWIGLTWDVEKKKWVTYNTKEVLPYDTGCTPTKSQETNHCSAAIKYTNGQYITMLPCNAECRYLCQILV